VAAGECVVPIQAEAAIYYPWPGIVYLPIQDAPTYQRALVWRTASTNPLIRAFTEAAAEIGPMTTNPPATPPNRAILPAALAGRDPQ
jgi:hypothetical protein